VTQYRITHKSINTGNVIGIITYDSLGDLIDDFYDAKHEITVNDIVTVIDNGVESKSSLHDLIIGQLWSVVGIESPKAECA
jgi:hypothetical protein